MKTSKIFIVGMVTTLAASIGFGSSSDNSLCHHLLAKTSKLMAGPEAKASSSMAQLSELMSARRMQADFYRLLPSAIEQKLTWSQFKNSHDNFSDTFQPHYERAYMEKYCGKAKIEGSIGSDSATASGSIGQSSASFERSPKLTDHPGYQSEIKGTK